MIYRNKFMVNPVKNIKVSFNNFFQPVITNKDENLLNPNDGIIVYNFFTKDGSLKNGLGLKDLTLKNSRGVDYVIKSSDTEVKGLWTARWLNNANTNVEDYLFYMVGNNVCYLDLKFPQYTFTMENTFTDIPSITKIRQNLTLEAFAFTSSDGLVILNQSTETLYNDVPNIMDACYHYNKLFAITQETRNALVYSSQTDVSLWTNSNTYRIDFTDDRGRLLKIMAFNDDLYVFREFGITKVTPYSMNTDFSIDHLYESSSYIYPQTISIYGNYVIFMTKDGLYSFNGSSVKKLDYTIIEKVEKIESSSPCGIGFNGKYYLACKIDFAESKVGCENSEYVNNSVIIFDFEKKDFQILRGIDIKQFASLNSVNLNKLCAIFNGDNNYKIGEFVDGGQVFGEVYENKWSSGLSDLGYTDKLKHVSELKILAEANCEFLIESDETSKTYQITGSSKVQRIKIDVKGKLLKFSFKSNSLLQKISKPEISVTVQMWN